MNIWIITTVYDDDQHESIDLRINMSLYSLVATLGPNLESNFNWILQVLTCKLGPRSGIIIYQEPPPPPPDMLGPTLRGSWAI